MQARSRCATTLQSLRPQCTIHLPFSPFASCSIISPDSAQHGYRVSSLPFALLCLSARTVARRQFHHGQTSSQNAAASLQDSVDHEGDPSPTIPKHASIPEKLPKRAQHDSAQAKAKALSKVYKIDLPKSNLESAIATMRLARTHNLPTEEVVLEPSPPPLLPQTSTTRLIDNPSLAAQMKQDLSASRAKKQSRASWMPELPITAEHTQKALLEMVEKNDVTIILAKTGSGKTTQVPQILVDGKILAGLGPMANVVCTQPRRIAATSIAQRVADERVGLLHRSVGYHIRNENLTPVNHGGAITYCTTGILLNRLVANADATLASHSHIIIDEVHERDILIDLAVSLIRGTLRANKAAGLPYPKVVLMSATIDPSTFINYFKQPASDGTTLTVDCLDVEGRQAYVEHHYLPQILSKMSHHTNMVEPVAHFVQGTHHQSSKQFIEHELRIAVKQKKQLSTTNGDTKDSTGQPQTEEDDETELSGPMRPGLAATVIAHIALNEPKGDILAFFAGGGDIENVATLLENTHFKSAGLDMDDRSKFRLFKLHSMRRDTNSEVFDGVPAGCRRIILATNIAETSITLPEVVYVVDSGKERNSHFDPATYARSLPYEWISKTSLIQRSGRAGRVRDGHYYALFTKERHDSLRAMNRPKIGSSDLEEVALQLKAFPQHADAKDILLNTIDPPSPHAVTRALQQLRSLGALTENEDITSLGRILYRLAVHPTLGKGILLGSLFGCLEPMLIIACHDAKSPLISSLDAGFEQIKGVKRLYHPEYETDFAWIVEAFKEYHAAVVAADHSRVHELQQTRFIRHRAYLDMIAASRGIHDILARAGFAPPTQPAKTVFELLPPGLNANANNFTLVKALLVNTVSAELAIWPGVPGHRGAKWSINSPVLAGMTSRIGVNFKQNKPSRDIQKLYRTHGRLQAYTWKQEPPDGPDGKVFLEQASMITPLMAILFCRDLALKDAQTLELNNWLTLQFSSPVGVSPAIGQRAATILMELRKTIDRTMSLAWLELEKLNRSARKTDQPTRRLGPELRKIMVNAVLEMLAADDNYWSEYRMKRRAEIDQEIERLKREKEENQASQVARVVAEDATDEVAEVDDEEDDDDDRTLIEGESESEDSQLTTSREASEASSQAEEESVPKAQA